MRFEYPAKITKEDQEIIVSFPDFPEAITSGHSIETAIAEAKDALEEAIAGRINRSERIPKPSHGQEGMIMVPVPPQMAMKSSLYIALIKNNDLNQSDLAKRLCCDEKEVRRMLDPRHNTKLIRLQEALAALNTTAVIETHALQPFLKISNAPHDKTSLQRV